jgi:hypothetical protein
MLPVCSPGGTLVCDIARAAEALACTRPAGSHKELTRGLAEGDLTRSS